MNGSAMGEWQRAVLGRPADLLRRRVAVYVVVTLGCFALACVLDGWAWRAWHTGKGVERWDWYRLLRLFGWMPVWLWVSGVWLLADWRRACAWLGDRPWWVRLNAAASRAVLVVLAPALSGGLAEALKPMLRRLRPGELDAGYVFRAWWDWAGGPLDGTGLGLPSGHSAVAFGAVFVLCRLLPGAWPVLIPAALGCAASRIMAGAHYLSDTVLAACLAWAVVAFLWRVHEATQRYKTATGQPVLNEA